MRSNNRNRASSGESLFWEIAIAAIAVISILTFQALRSLLRPSTRDYRPVAYDQPYSRSSLAEYFTSVGTVRLVYGLILLLTLVIAIVLLPGIVNGTTTARQTFPLVALTALSLLSVLLSILSVPTVSAVAMASFLFYSLHVFATAIVPQVSPLFLSLLICTALIFNGVGLLMSVTVPGRERDMHRVWIESAAVVILILTIVASGRTYGPSVIAFGLVAVTLLGTALLNTSAKESERLHSFVLLLLVLVALVALGTRPNSSIGGVLLI